MNIYKEIVIPDESELFIVGDLHGEFDLYEKGCRELGIKNSDVVVSVGDLVDRGDKNFKCVSEFLRKDNRYAVQGNHEDLMIKAFCGGSRQHYECWFFNGGETTLDELGEEGSSLISEMFKELPVILGVKYRGKTLGVVHGGLPHMDVLNNWDNMVDFSVKTPNFTEKLIWDRSVIDQIQSELRSDESSSVSEVKGIDYVFHGHTPVKNALIQENRIYIDTGGVFNGRLTFAYFQGEELKFYTTGDEL